MSSYQVLTDYETWMIKAYEVGDDGEKTLIWEDPVESGHYGGCCVFSDIRPLSRAEHRERRVVSLEEALLAAGATSAVRLTAERMDDWFNEHGGWTFWDKREH
jgi:hypothetical protein